MMKLVLVLMALVGNVVITIEASRLNQRAPPCDRISCIAQGTECVVVAQQPQCICKSTCPRPTSLSAFVCGSDGQRYLTRCLMNKSACEQGVSITEVGCGTHAISSVAAHSNEPTRIIENPQLRVIGRGGSVLLQCPITDYPDTQYIWSKQGVENIRSSAVGVVFNDDGRSLKINNAILSHEGVYECEAINRWSHISLQYRVSVEDDNERCRVPARQQVRQCTGRNRRRFWTFNPTTLRCVRTKLRTCEAVTNKFDNRWECEKVCKYQCGSTLRRGSCHDFSVRLHYNTDTGACQPFVFGGCQGNRNNFRHIDQCQRKCVRRRGLRNSCPMCTKNIALSYCDDDFAISGIVTSVTSPNVKFPYVAINLTDVFKDNGQTMDDVSRDQIVREFNIKTRNHCPCPDFQSLLHGITLGEPKAEVIITGKYIYGHPTISQGSLALLATPVFLARMRTNRDNGDLCPMLQRMRNNGPS